jgi:hypothetical protein
MPNGQNNFKVRNWSDVASLAAIVVFIISGLVWFMKLEARIDEHNRLHAADIKDIRDDLKEIQRQVGNGILPRAEERIRHLEDRLRRHEEEHE